MAFVKDIHENSPLIKWEMERFGPCIYPFLNGDVLLCACILVVVVIAATAAPKS